MGLQDSVCGNLHGDCGQEGEAGWWGPARIQAPGPQLWCEHRGPSVRGQPEGARAEEVLLGVEVEGHRYRHQLRSCSALSSQYHVILALWICSELYLFRKLTRSTSV